MQHACRTRVEFGGGRGRRALPQLRYQYLELTFKPDTLVGITDSSKHPNARNESEFSRVAPSMMMVMVMMMVM